VRLFCGAGTDVAGDSAEFGGEERIQQDDHSDGRSQVEPGDVVCLQPAWRHHPNRTIHPRRVGEWGGKKKEEIKMKQNQTKGKREEMRLNQKSAFWSVLCFFFVCSQALLFFFSFLFFGVFFLSFS
jgi:hypothetical protein